jgi:hypothetical protein
VALHRQQSADLRPGLDALALAGFQQLLDLGEPPVDQYVVVLDRLGRDRQRAVGQVISEMVSELVSPASRCVPRFETVLIAKNENTVLTIAKTSGAVDPIDSATATTAGASVRNGMSGPYVPRRTSVLATVTVIGPAAPTPSSSTAATCGVEGRKSASLPRRPVVAGRRRLAGEEWAWMSWREL